MTDDSLPGSNPLDSDPSNEELDMFVMGGIEPARGVQVGGVIDIDADVNSEAGERTRVVKPYRWWTFTVVLLGAALVGVAAWGQWSAGLANFGNNTMVSFAYPTSAVSYPDGTVVVMMAADPVRVCEAGSGGCEPNQVLARWSADGNLSVGMLRESPEGADWAVATECSTPTYGAGGEGRIVLRSPSGQAPRSVMNYFTGDPVSTGQAAAGQDSPFGLGVEGIPAPANCVAGSDRTEMAK